MLRLHRRQIYLWKTSFVHVGGIVYYRRFPLYNKNDFLRRNIFFRNKNDIYENILQDMYSDRTEYIYMSRS
jgi:hypothetical protein